MATNSARFHRAFAVARNIRLARRLARRAKIVRFHALRALGRIFGPGRATFRAGGDTLTFVVTCKGRLGHLKRTLPQMLKQANTRVVVVDSRCPDGAGEWVRAHFPEVKVVMLDDGGLFNGSTSRNAGLAVCESEWICFIDADVVVANDFSSWVAPRLAPGHFYRFELFPGRYDLIGTCIVRSDDARAVQGYDEVITGYAGEDTDFYSRLGLSGLRPVVIPSAAIAEVIAHGDELRVAHAPSPDLWFDQSATVVYRLAKFHMIANGGENRVTEADRRNLYEQARSTLREALRDDDGVARLQMEIPAGVDFQARLGKIRQIVTIEIATGGARHEGEERP
jgi:glycosyltransferase involved in cell wall biosynthesis